MPVALTPSSSALTWFPGTQTGLMSSWAAECLISRKAKRRERREQGLGRRRPLSEQFPSLGLSHLCSQNFSLVS